jgi:hypothetical protein
VCSSLTELFAPEIHKQRLATWPEHYPWIDGAGLTYFRERISRARRDVEQGLAITLDRFTSRVQQERALEVLQFKLDILWAMNDAMALKYGVMGMAPSPLRGEGGDGGENAAHQHLTSTPAEGSALHGRAAPSERSGASLVSDSAPRQGGGRNT